MYVDIVKSNILNLNKHFFSSFSYNKNVNFPDISVGNNKINTIKTNFKGMHLDKKKL